MSSRAGERWSIQQARKPVHQLHRDVISGRMSGMASDWSQRLPQDKMRDALRAELPGGVIFFP